MSEETQSRIAELDQVISKLKPEVPGFPAKLERILSSYATSETDTVEKQLATRQELIKRLAGEIPGLSLKLQRIIEPMDLNTPAKGPGPHWTMANVRQTFIEFFEKKKGHTFFRSSPVVPHNDPTLLFNNAGMCQFKPIFLGQVDPSDPRAKLKRAANSQKCIRAGGKHNDLDDVGKDLYHHTFFEMLGNWSFGDFGKEEIIDWSWELLTDVFGLDPNRLYATYYGGDENGNGVDLEAKKFWMKHLPENRILPFDAKENFWEMGDTGPCGPCSEISYDRIGGRDASHLVNQDDPDVLEIWNLVFMTMNRKPDGSLEMLPAENVDTGMGFERVLSCLQDKKSNYDTDAFTPLFDRIFELSGVEQKYQGRIGEEDVGNLDMAYRVVADHIRTLTFSITDGAMPSNLGRGYVLRRVLRRAVRYGQEILLIEKPFLSDLVDTLVDMMKDAFPELVEKKELVKEVLLDEEVTFQRTLKKGVDAFKSEVADLKAKGITKVPGSLLFFLYGSMGFPVDLTELMAEEHGMTVDRDEFEKLMEEEKEVSRQRNKNRSGEGRSLKVFEAKETAFLESKGIAVTVEEAKFEWHTTIESTVTAIYNGEEFVDELSGDTLAAVLLDKSNFYFEAGGQLADHGTLEVAMENGAKFVVENCQSSKGYIMHMGTLQDGNGALKVGDKVTCNVDFDRRKLLANNHTATHVLNFGLRSVLGGEVDQKGSLVSTEKLRFDFNAMQPVTPEQLRDVELVVQKQISTALPVYTKVVPLADAQRVKALRAVFGETYPDPVRVVIVGKPVDEVISNPDSDEWFKYSVELCGGTHLRNSADAKAFVLTEELGIAKGTRRVIGVTGEDALQAIADAEELESKLQEAQYMTGADLDNAVRVGNDAVNKATISAYTKVSLRERYGLLKKKLLEEEKQRKAAQVAAGTEEAVKVCTIAMESGAKFAVMKLTTTGNIVGKVVEAVGKKFPELSVCAVMDDPNQSKMSVAMVVPKAHVALGMSAKAWLAAVNEKINGKGGGSTAKASGNADLGCDADAIETATTFASSTLPK